MKNCLARYVWISLIKVIYYILSVSKLFLIRVPLYKVFINIFPLNLILKTTTWLLGINYIVYNLFL